MGLFATVARELVAAGLEGEALCAALERVESHYSPVDDAAERRRAYDRERKRLRNSAESAESAETPPLETKVPTPLKTQTLPKENPPKGGQKKGTRLPSDWDPSEENLDDALRIGVPRDCLAREAEKFHDYWISKPGADGCKLSWDATWRNWCRNIRPNGQGPPQNPKSKPISNAEASVNALEKFKSGHRSNPEPDFGAGATIETSDYRRVG